MTREEAIKTLRELWRETNDSWYEEVYDMAIEALSAEAEQVTGKLKNPCDSLLKSDSDECKEQKSKLDLISRQDIIGYIDRVRNSGLGKNKSLEYIRKYVERVLSAEALEVVLCRDCKHWNEWENMTGSCHRSENGYNWFGVDATDFCSFGERRDA